MGSDDIQTKPFISTAGWSIPAREKSSFPECGSHLKRYSQVFNSVEINSSFYKDHKFETYQRWSDTVPANFRFSVKLNKLFTHECDLKPRVRDLAATLKTVQGLGKKWEVLLMQFPSSSLFNEKKMDRFFDIIRRFHSGPIVLEPRNLSWITSEAEGLMKNYKVSKVIADPERCPGGGKEVSLLGGITYYRLHGAPQIYRSSYSEEFIRNLMGEILLRKKVWCVFDNTALGMATGNALRAMELSALNSKTA